MSIAKCNRRSLTLYIIVTLILASESGAFVSSPGARGGVGVHKTSVASTRIATSNAGVPRALSTRLFGVKEWKASQPGNLRQVGFLPFPVDDVMCPGETKALHLYEARFLSLFENAIKHNGGCVGGAIFVDDGVLVRVGQLCDIISWNREEVGVSVTLRCVGRVEIADIKDVDPYIQATVREVNDEVDSDPLLGGEVNAAVSADVFDLHRRCVAIEDRMSAVAGTGWESQGAGVTVDDPGGARRRSSTFFSDNKGGEGEGEEILSGRDDPGNREVGDISDDEDDDDLVSKFRRGGGELDVSTLESPTAAAGGEEADPDDDREETGGESRRLDELLWGHETRNSDGFDSSLEEQLEDRYTSLKADVSVSLEGSGTESGSTTGRGTGGLGGEGGPQAIADMFTSGQINSGGIVDAGSSSSSAEEGVAFFGQGQAQETAFLWGCASEQQERDQLLSFVCLGCFDPAARLQSLMLRSTGQRLRMARDALTERLKVLAAKSALNDLGD